MADSIYNKELARYYDLIYSGKDYEKEAGYVKDLILTNKKSKGMALLEVACGTGKHLEHIEDDFKCIGLDLNKEMLKVARKRLRKARLVQGNMIDFNLNQKFDVIICIHSDYRSPADTALQQRESADNQGNRLVNNSLLHSPFRTGRKRMAVRLLSEYNKRPAPWHKSGPNYTHCKYSGKPADIKCADDSSLSQAALIHSCDNCSGYGSCSRKHHCREPVYTRSSKQRDNNTDGREKIQELLILP